MRHLYSLNANLPPFADLLSTSGKVGAPLEILGQGFTTANSVTFGSVPAAFKVFSDTYMTTTVPNGATTGTVSVNTSGGNLASSKIFRVIPSLKSFSPPSGLVGTSVTITGVSLTQASRVTFGGVPATSFAVNSDDQITATVPNQARTGRISVITRGGTALTSTNFTVTP